MLCLKPDIRLILASASPRRRELLTECGLKFDVVVSDVDETVGAGETPQALVQRLSKEKAMVVAEQFPQAWVLGADTDVVLNGEVFGKPTDRDNAIEMMNRLQGSIHEVWGAFTLLNKESGVKITESVMTQVRMMELTATQVEAYVDTGEPMDKAGGYAIQGVGAHLIVAIHGSYTNVVGLNLSGVVSALRRAKIIEDGSDVR